MTDPIGILLADDHPLFREGVAHSLAAEADFAVIGQAASGEEALRLLDRQQQQQDILQLQERAEVAHLRSPKPELGRINRSKAPTRSSR